MSDSPPPKLPRGFLASGFNAGIKSTKRDLGLIVTEWPAHLAACVTTNRSRAHCANRTAALLEKAGPARAVIAISGNANALTGPEGKQDDEAMARAAAQALGIAESEVVTASTGVIGARMPLAKIVEGIPGALAGLSSNPSTFSEAILTTDRVPKIAFRDIFVDATRIRIHAVCKGAGMISPAMATMLCFVTTDAAIDRRLLQQALTRAVERTFNQITVDGDMSTNDCVVVLANGAAENEPINGPGPAYDAFAAALDELLEEEARAIARDGEGATRMLEVEVKGAASTDEARALALAVADSSLVKAAIFGADPYAWGRMVSAVGARAATKGAAYDVNELTVALQGATVFAKGVPVAEARASASLKHKMAEPEIRATFDLGMGTAHAFAWGCDLTYDYVKVNADYASVTTTKPDGSVAVNERLAELGPTIKKKLLIEALRYIDRFDGKRAVIKLGGAAMVDPKLESDFADDVLLLQSVGLRPIVVHGGGPEITRTLDKLGHSSHFVDGLRVTDKASMAVVEMVLSGSVNQRLVAALNRNGAKGVGLSGKDGGLIRARKLEGPRDLGQVGEVESVNSALIDMLERDGYIPVISPIGIGSDGAAYNINADTVAAELAIATKAHKLIYLSDVPGLLDGDQVVSELDGDQLQARIERGDVTGGMLPKLQAALRALRGGIQYIHLVDGRVTHNVIAELFTDHGVGTLIRRA